MFHIRIYRHFLHFNLKKRAPYYLPYCDVAYKSSFTVSGDVVVYNVSAIHMMYKLSPKTHTLKLQRQSWDI